MATVLYCGEVYIPPRIQEKTKWATFTYFGSEARVVTKLFRNTNIKVAFKANNTIQRHLRLSGKIEDIYNLSGAYQVKCEECPLRGTNRTQIQGQV
jgi:hypothetical protein